MTEWWDNRGSEWYDHFEMPPAVGEKRRMIIGRHGVDVPGITSFEYEYQPYIPPHRGRASPMLWRRTDQPRVPEECRDGVIEIDGLWFESAGCALLMELEQRVPWRGETGIDRSPCNRCQEVSGDYY